MNPLRSGPGTALLPGPGSPRRKGWQQNPEHPALPHCCVPSRVTHNRKPMSLAFKSAARVVPSSASYEQALRCSTAAWPAAPGGHRRVKGSANTRLRTSRTRSGSHSFIYRRSRPPVAARALQNTERKGEVIDAV